MRRGGFTLVEVLAAVLVTAVAALVARQTFAACTEAAADLRSAGREHAAAANADRWLTEALGSVVAESSNDAAFTGEPDRLRFATWLTSAHGWPERSTVTLRLDGGALVASHSQGQIVLAQDARAAAFDYLVEPGLESRWLTRWESEATVPAAVRLRLSRLVSGHLVADTVVLILGSRG
jgi:prepilin-type N-terminal cleavage/methylation domain-containing protein